MSEKRTRQKPVPLSIRLTPKNRAGVERYSEQYQISMSDFINMCVANYIETNDLVNQITGQDEFKNHFKEMLEQLKK